eukprot:767988-Hanusia_phi.AAC.3
MESVQKSRKFMSEEEEAKREGAEGRGSNMKSYDLMQVLTDAGVTGSLRSTGGMDRQGEREDGGCSEGGRGATTRCHLSEDVKVEVSPDVVVLNRGQVIDKLPVGRTVKDEVPTGREELQRDVEEEEGVDQDVHCNLDSVLAFQSTRVTLHLQEGRRVWD